jgi:hypothetical protein
MRKKVWAVLFASLSFNAVPALAAPDAVVTPLLTKPLPELKGKEGVMILVDYPLELQTRSIDTTRTSLFMCSRDQS